MQQIRQFDLFKSRLARCTNMDRSVKSGIHFQNYNLEFNNFFEDFFPAIIFEFNFGLKVCWADAGRREMNIKPKIGKFH